ncbi:MAG: hypothetical protein HYU26_03900, partial [Candidatus Rokubacteria bacterium]|nr:hypothetical protein [Candidatus Rokubacteria bacterium]
LWEGDGTFSPAGHASYDTVSRCLAEEIQHLLLRLGIVSRLYERSHAYRGRRAVSFVITITGRENLRQFHRLVAHRFLDPRKRQRARALVGTHIGRRSSRDIIPVKIRAVIDRERLDRGATWNDVGRGAGVALRALVSPHRSKRGYRRWVIARLARYFRSYPLTRLAHSDLYWDRVVAVEPGGIRETFDLHVAGAHNFLANDLVVHNSHAASFALLAYASAWLRVHHPAAFYAALLNNQPMGFYHPATIVKDAQRHGLRIRPVDVTRSAWLCTLAAGAVRLGLRYVRGLRESAGRALVAARATRPFASLEDLRHRAGLDRDELVALAAIGALAPLGGTRRQHLWAATAPDPGPLFAAAARAGDDPAEGAGPLAEMTPAERLVADYAGTGVTLGRHPMALRRAGLRRRGVLSARELVSAEPGASVRTAGSVIVRQRPGTAKGFVFLSLEDETGIANVIVTPRVFARHRAALVGEPFLLVEGVVQRQDGVVSLRATRVAGLPALGHHVPSHDFG